MGKSRYFNTMRRVLPQSFQMGGAGCFSMQVHNTVARHGKHAAHVAEMPLRGFDVLPLGKKDADAVQVFVLVADFCAVILHGLQQGFAADGGVVEHNQGAFGVLRCGALRRLQAAFGGRYGALASSQKDDGQEQGREFHFGRPIRGSPSCRLLWLDGDALRFNGGFGCARRR